MKKILLPLIACLLLIGVNVYAQDMTIDSNGYVGIGTTSPNYELEVVGNVEADGFTINGIPLGTSSDSYWSATGGDIYYNSGYVGIWTMNPGYELDVAGTINASIALKVNGVDVLTSYTETDPVYTSMPAFGITFGLINNWNTAYLWGDHYAAGYDESDDAWIGIGNVHTLSGNVGIGTALPGARLHIEKSSGDDLIIGQDINSGFDGGVDVSISDDDNYSYVFIGQSESSKGLISWAYNPDPANASFQIGTFGSINPLIFQPGGGDVGIETLIPSAKLDVYGTRSISSTSDGIVNIGQSSGYHVTLDNNEIHARNGTGTSNLYINDFGGNVYIAKQGNVGIGTSITSEKLTVEGNAYFSGNVGIGSTSLLSPLSVQSGNNSSWTVGNGFGDFYVGDGTYGLSIGVATQGVEAGNVNIWPTEDYGRISFGTAINGKFLEVNGASGYVSFGDIPDPVGSININFEFGLVALYMDANYSPQTPQYGHHIGWPETEDFRISSVHEITPGLDYELQERLIIRGATNEVLIPGTVHVGELQTTNDSIRLTASDGRVKAKILELTNGADIAEPFDVRDPSSVKEGMVMSIDPDNPGQLKISDRAYNRAVAGIVSGAGGINAAMLMGQAGSKANGATPVALTGRVYAWADASINPIEPGDLLTTSDVAGHAMKVENYSKAQGAIIGKAMTSLQNGKGLVLVLVSLQ